jgi:hypothetical protein
MIISRLADMVKGLYVHFESESVHQGVTPSTKMQEKSENYQKTS